MKNSTRLLILLVAGLFMFSTAVYAGNDAPRTGFVDLNGDGINDNAKDDDADGIPNNLDADFLKSEDGSNNQNTNQSKEQFKEQSKEQSKEMEQLTFHWRTHEQSKELFQNQYGELGDGSHNGQVTESTNKGSENAAHKGGK